MAPGRPVAAIVGSRELADHAEKLRGFAEAAGELGLPLAGVGQSHDDPLRSYPLAESLLDEHPGLGGLYIGTDNGAEVCRCVWERGLAGKLAVVATGTFAEIREYLRKKVVQLTFFQNMPRQGATVVEVLARHLLDGRAPPPIIRIAPDIVAESNLDLYGP
jgi:ABC-type sugar transport system substrate-binding protein